MIPDRRAVSSRRWRNFSRSPRECREALDCGSLLPLSVPQPCCGRGGIKRKIRKVPRPATRSQKCMLRRMREARGGCARRKPAAGLPQSKGWRLARAAFLLFDSDSLFITPTACAAAFRHRCPQPRITPPVPCSWSRIASCRRTLDFSRRCAASLRRSCSRHLRIVGKRTRGPGRGSRFSRISICR